MKKITLHFVCLLILAIPYNINAQKWKELMEKPNANFYEIKKAAHNYFKEYEKEKLKNNNSTRRNEEEEEEESKDGDYNKYMRWEWFWSTRILPDGTFPDLTTNLAAYQKERTNTTNTRSLAATTWVNFSQTTAAGGYNGMGRANDVAFDPTNVNKYYVATPGGGVWKTTNGSNTYTPISDFAPHTRTGVVIVDKNNANTLYVTLGDYNYYISLSNNMGVYKSTDGGATWSATGLNSQLSAGLRIYEMVISPSNSNVLFAATNNGLMRTTNGGTNWSSVRTGSYSDVKFKPGDANTVYAALYDYYGSQVFKSIDGGTNWTQATNFSQIQTQLRLGVTPANPNMLAVESSKQLEFYVSTNSGGSFTFKSNYPQDEMFIISPNNANIIYSGSLVMYKSTDGGVNWTQMTNWGGGTTGGRPEIHADFHNAKYSPINTNYIYFCNDGGVYRYNESNDVWTDLSNGLIITQFYSIATAQTNANVIIGGTQDNGGRMRNAAGTWRATSGGDGMVQAIDKTDANVIYTTYVNGQLYRSQDGWVNDTYNDISANIPGGKPTGDWVTPYTLDPSNNSTIVAGYNDVYRSTNRGTNWTKISNNIAGGGNNTLKCLEIAPSNSAVIYTSRGNTLYQTTNMGGNWTTYTVPGSEGITAIAIHPTNSNTLWITKGGYTSGSKVFKSTNGGSTWTNVSGTLPNIPMNAIMYEENNNADALYLGSDIGVYYTNNTMSDWTFYSNGLPNVPVMDFAIYYPTKKLRIGTYGRGMWEIDLYSSSVVTNCTGTTADATWEYINRVQFGNIDNTSAATTYTDFTAKNTSALRGSNMNIAVTIGKAYAADKVLIWCDWNNDKIFDPTTELAATLDSITSGPNPYKGVIKIPVNAFLGKIKMRIKMIDDANGPDYDPCGTTGYGEVEDYSITCTDNVTSIDPAGADNKPFINVYPNPNNGAFTLDISFPDNGSYNVEIANVLGQIIYTESLNINNSNYNYSKKLNLSDLSKGVYIIHLNGDKTNATKKISME